MRVGNRFVCQCKDRGLKAYKKDNTYVDKYECEYPKSKNENIY